MMRNSEVVWLASEYNSTNKKGSNHVICIFQCQEDFFFLIAIVSRSSKLVHQIANLYTKVNESEDLPFA